MHKPPFLRALDEMGQNYVGEVPVNFTAWTKPPAMLYREHANRRMGRPRKLPRLKVKNNPPAEVRHIASYSPRSRDVVWQDYHVKDGHKGRMVWRATRIPVWLRGEDGLPGAPHHLVAAYNVQEPEKVKYFISNAPPDTPVETLLLVALSRWKIERMFEDGKGELGMDHFEVRRFQSIRRHLILSCVSYLFLAEFHEAHRGENPALTLCQIRTATRLLVPLWIRGGRCSRKFAESISRQLVRTQHRNAKAQRSHRKRTLRRLHNIGMYLKDLRTCQWNPS